MLRAEPVEGVVEEMFRVANSALVALVLLVAITFFARPLAFSRFLFGMVMKI